MALELTPNKATIASVKKARSQEIRRASIGKLKTLLIAGTMAITLASGRWAPERDQVPVDEEMVFYHDTTVQYRVETYKGITIMIERTGREDEILQAAYTAADVIDEVNQNMPQDKRVYELRLRDQDTSILEMPRMSGMCYNDQAAYGLYGIMRDKDRKMESPFHEAAHGYEESGEVDTAMLGGIYRRMEEETRGCTDRGNHPLWGIFKESNYVEGSDPRWGHIENWSELFASSSTNMKFQAPKVIAALGSLWENSRQYYMLAYEALRKVAMQWKNRIFPPEMYKALGLE